MISLNATIFAQVTLFLILLVILNRMMIQPLHRLVLEREAALEGKKGELETAHDRLRALVSDYQNRLADAEREARRTQRELRMQGNREAEKIMASTQEQVVALRQKVRAEVSEELEAARKKIKNQAEKLSFEITQKIVGRRV